MLDAFNELSKYQLKISDIDALEKILSDRKQQKSAKVKELVQIFECGPREDKSDAKICKEILSNLCKFLVGAKGNITRLFDTDFDEMETSSFSFGDS